jgi:glycosyltransferase involved in cell wall biosynthesis
MLLAELAKRHTITLVGLCWNESDRLALDDWAGRGLEVHSIPHGLRSWVGGSYRAIRQPLQHVVSTSPALAGQVRRLIADARAAGRPFDVVHVEHLRGAAAADLLAGFGVWTVYDAVDCISELARLTWKLNPAPVTRLVAWREQQPTRRLERAFATAADCTTVVAERDAEALRDLNPAARIEVIPNGVTCLPVPVELTCQPSVIFTGKLSYHANQAAIRRFLAESWPWVVQAVPDARLVIAGADPPGWLLDRADGASVKVVANPPEMASLISEARVSIAPMSYSVGIQNKILEAMAAGVPVVATSVARSGIGPAGADALIHADDPREFAAEVIRLLTEDRLARQLGRLGYDYVRANHSWEAAATHFEALYAPERAMQWTA